MEQIRDQEKLFIIMIGRSGCGKGTQSELIIKYLEDKKNIKPKYISSGGALRKFAQDSSHTAKKILEILNRGMLVPEFLMIRIWTNIFIESIGPDDSILIDGGGRKILEAMVMGSAIDFYDYKNILVIYLDVSESWAKKRLVERGREDDRIAEYIERKMSWFEEDTTKCLEYYKTLCDRYRFLHIDGEKSVEDVHREIVSKMEAVVKTQN